MVTILGREIPNRIEELTIEQFEAITDINNNKELDPVDRHLQIFEYLGIPESEFFDFDIADFIDRFGVEITPIKALTALGVFEDNKDLLIKFVFSLQKSSTKQNNCVIPSC